MKGKNYEYYQALLERDRTYEGEFLWVLKQRGFFAVRLVQQGNPK